MKRQVIHKKVGFLVGLVFFVPLILMSSGCNMTIVTDLDGESVTLLPPPTVQATDYPLPDMTEVANAEATQVSSTATAAPSETMTSAPTITRTPCVAQSDWLIYRVVPGDTLSSIARRTGTTTSQLAGANCLSNPNSLVSGQMLYVPVLPAPETTNTSAKIVDFHAEPNPADPAGVTALSWTVSGTDHVSIKWQSKNGQSAVNPRLPASGSLPVSLPGVAISSFKSVFYLCAENATGQIMLDATGAQVCKPLEVRLTTPMHVVSFAVSPNPAKRGDVLTVSWEVTAAARVAVWLLDTPGGRIRVDLGGQLPAKGSLQYTVPDSVTSGSLPFVLYTSDAYGIELTTSLNIPIACAYSTTLVAGCPITQKQIQAAYQPFTGGFMVWRGDTRQIYVVFNTAVYSTYADTWTEGEVVVVNETPPPGTIQPVRGFGKLWAAHPEIRSALGWAVANESGYQTLVETRSFSSLTTTALKLPDNRILILYSGGQWQFAR